MGYTEDIFEAGTIIMKNPGLMEMMVKFKSTRSIALANYAECARLGLERIENLPEDERKRLWKMANEIGKGESKKTLIDLCRCIHWYEKMKS